MECYFVNSDCHFIITHWPVFHSLWSGFRISNSTTNSVATGSSNEISGKNFLAIGLCVLGSCPNILLNSFLVMVGLGAAHGLGLGGAFCVVLEGPGSWICSAVGPNSALLLEFEGRLFLPLRLFLFFLVPPCILVKLSADWTLTRATYKLLIMYLLQQMWTWTQPSSCTILNSFTIVII